VQLHYFVIIISHNTCFTLLLFSYFNISQGSVAMLLMYDNIFNNDYCKFTTEFICKNFENGLMFGSVMDRSLVSSS